MTDIRWSSSFEGYCIGSVLPSGLRRKDYEIQLKGNGVADRQNEIFEQLLYNANKINNRKVAFEGESIVQFEHERRTAVQLLLADTSGKVQNR